MSYYRVGQTLPSATGCLIKSIRESIYTNIVIGIAIFSAATGSFAQEHGPRSTPTGLTWGELALLPDYCKDAQGIVYGDATNPSPRASMWVSRMGEGFWAIHHYCYALAGVRRAEAAGVSPTTRRFLYGRAIQDYLYTIKNSDPEMPLIPEILVRVGEAYLKLGNVTEANAAFERARALKPDYWPAYSRWVEVLIGLNLRKEALALAERGLAHAQDSEVLRNQITSLGGDPAKVAAANQSASASSSRGAADSPVPSSAASATGTQ